ncbi:MAG: MerR family transcriptional regulator [Candidatus Zhuqueibacterota bacterium]
MENKIKAINFYHTELNAHYNSSIGKSISILLNSKKSRLIGHNISYRVINHWEKMGILDTKKETDKKWRRYSIIDLVWIQVTIILRTFGYPLEKILTAKRNLEMNDWESKPTQSSFFEEDNIKNKPVQFPLFEMHIGMAFFKGEEVYLLVFPDGNAVSIMIKEPLSYDKLKELGDHIIISINNILKKLFPENNMSAISQQEPELSSEEI